MQRFGYQAVHAHAAAPAALSLRIALVTEAYPPEVNGAALAVSHLAEGLRQRGHRLQVLRPHQAADGLGPGTAAGERPTLLRCVPVPFFPHLRVGLPASNALRAHWREDRPDLVHVVTEGPLGWSAVRVANELALPISSDFRANFQACCTPPTRGWMQKAVLGYLRRLHNATACTMVPTEALRADLQQAGFERLVVVARGVDTQRFDPSRRSEEIRRRWGVRPTQRVVLYAGRLAAEENLDLLLRAYEAMRRVDPQLKLVLVGEGPLRESLRQRCPDAVLAGQRVGTDLAAHYASADLFLIPSLTETLDNVTREAMASGLPVLAFDHAASGHLITHGHNGWLAEAGDEGSFIELAMGLVREPQQARRAGESARLSALELGWDGIVQQVESVFLSTLIARHSGGTMPHLLARWGAA